METEQTVQEGQGQAQTVDKVEIPIKRERVADLLIAAFEGGSNYWYQIEGYEVPPVVKAHVMGGPMVYKYADYPLCDGGAVVVSDAKVKAARKMTKVRLDWARVKGGLEAMAVKYPKHFGLWLSEDDDANTADVFLQCCVFGDLVYG